MKKLALLASLLAMAAFGLAACGGDDEEEPTTAETTETTESSGGGGEGGTLSVEADPDGALAYTTTELSAPAGPLTIEFDNPSSTGHDVVIEDPDGNELARTDVITADTTTADAELEAGEYTYYCSVDAHREAGMEGALTVE